jgi:hypothetical protein
MLKGNHENDVIVPTAPDLASGCRTGWCLRLSSFAQLLGAGNTLTGQIDGCGGTNTFTQTSGILTPNFTLSNFP